MLIPPTTSRISVVSTAIRSGRRSTRWPPPTIWMAWWGRWAHRQADAVSKWRTWSRFSGADD